MNDHALRVLEFDRFLDLLSGYACSESGRARLRALRPAARPGDTASERQLYADCLAVRRRHVPLPAVRFEPPEEALTRAAPEAAVLDPEQFLIIRDLLGAADTVAGLRRDARCADAPALRELAETLDPCPDLGRRIARTFEDGKGHVRDEASERLRDLRHRIASLDRSIQSRLEAMLRDPALADAFQDAFVTTRHGRSVLPVRREQRGRLPGIVHDQSNSGATLFVEPEPIVEPGNALEILRLEERDEIRRILAALTETLRARLETLRRNFDLLTLYDSARAVGLWAADYDCRCPERGGRLRLVQARHPLLQHRLAQEGRLEALVPLDFEPMEGRNVIVITGSNTGGKTVALKTIGLLSLIAQAGLPIPAGEGTRVRFFADIRADIGDEQSIEQSLSTFSAHLEQIVATLAAARDAEALVLLDELGAGTDPVEGGALGCAILEALSRTAGLTVATTHLGAVKRFVHGRPRMANASMLFDVETLRPQYRLMMGRAGASYALTIAERCGLPADVVESARGFLSAGDRQVEAMLSDLERQQLDLERRLQTAEKTRGEAERSRERARRDEAEAGRALKDLGRERRRVLREAHGEAASLVADTRREVERLLSRARERPGREDAREMRRRIEQRREALEEGLRQTQERPEPPLRPGDLKPGDRVWVEFLKDHGRVAALSDDGRRAMIEVGRMRVELGIEDLCRPRPDAQPPAAPTPAVALAAPRHADVPAELNLIGQRVEEAVARLEQYLDAAILAQRAEVRIIHGYGTGALRKAVHAFLQTAPVTGFRLGEETRDPGGAGVTIVTL